MWRARESREERGERISWRARSSLYVLEPFTHGKFSISLEREGENQRVEKGEKLKESIDRRENRR